MSKEERIYLANKMPQKLECHDWVLTFSTSTQGFSLANMIRKLSDKQGGLLLVLSDVENNVFGAFLSNVPSISEHFEGEHFKIFLADKERRNLSHLSQHRIIAYSLESHET